MNKTRMGKRAASLLLSLVMMLSLLPTAAYAAMADGVDTQGAIVSENGTDVSDDSNSSGNTDDLQVGGSEGNGDTGAQQVGDSSGSGTAGDTTGAEGGADPTDSANENDSADPQDDGDAVMPVASSVVSTSEELVAAIAAANDGDTITLGEGEFTTYGNTSPKKSLTFVGAGTGTVWTIGNLSKDVKGEGNGDCSFDGCETITFQNMTLKSDGADYRGFIRISNTAVKKCTLVGKTAYWGYETAKFEDSTFNAPVGDYALWDYSTKAMTFEGCTFNISGKGVNVYVEQPSTDARTVEVNGCTVNSDKAGKAFLNIKNSTQAFDVTLSGTNTVTGLEANGTTGSALYHVETTEVTETTGKPVAVKAKADDGTVTTLYEVKETVEASVAEVNGAKYKSLQAAVDAAKSGATVTLLADTRENVTVSKNAIVLDLNGHTLNGGTENAKPALTVDNKKVTLKDSSEAQTGTIKREDTADTKTSHYVIDIQGKNGFMIVESGKVENNSGIPGVKGSSLIRLGNDSVSGWPTLTIKGGTFTQDNFIAIKVDRGTLHLLGGTVNSANSFAIENWNNAYIKGGTVNGTVSTWVYSTGAAFSKLEISGGTVNGNVASVNYDNAADKQARVYVTGGTVTGTLGTYTYNNGLVAMDETAKATIEVTGGTFSKDPTQYVVEDSAISKNDDGTYGVAKTYLAKIGDTEYYTMDEAFHAVKAGETIAMLRDYTTNKVQNSGDESFTIDLGGHTWTANIVDTASAAFEINYSDVTLTVKNGKVVSSQLAGLIPSAMSGTITYNNSKLVFDGVEMTANGHSGIETNGSNTNDTVTLKNSTLNVPNGYGIYFPSSGTLTIDNSVINAKTMGVQVCSGSLNISGAGTAITVTGDGIAKTENDGAIEDGAAISIVNRTGYKGLSNIEVKDGKFKANGTNAAVKAYKWEDQTASAFDNSKNVVAISGGTFSSEVDKSLCADGFIPTKNEDGTYGVKEGQYVAEVGSTKYATLQAAIAAAQDGQTVTLLADVEQNTQLAINKSITLGLNGKTIKNTVEIWGDDTNAILSIKGGAKVTITGNGTIAAKENDCYTINVVNGDLTIENGTFVGNISVVQVQKGSLTINGGDFSLLQKMTDGKGENRYLINCIDDAYVDGSAKVAISGGTFVGFDPNVSPEQKVDGKTPSFAAPGAGITKNEDGSFTAAADMTAQILDKDGNSVKAYGALADAVAAAQDGQTVTLLADAAEDVVISKSITLDLGGKTLTNTNAGKATISVKSGTVTVKNGNVVGGNDYYNIEAKKDANLTLTDVTATAGNTGSSMIDNYGTLTITSGTYNGGLDTVKNEPSAKLTITGGTFTLTKGTSKGFTGVVFNYGELTISGGEFIQSDKSAPYGQAQVIHTDKSGSAAPSTVITGGTFKNLCTRSTAWTVRATNAAAGATKVSGGAFNKSISEAYCAEGFIPTKNSDGTYGVKEGQYVAKVGSKKYETLADAIRLAAKGGTVTLLADVEQNTQLTINKSITLDLNGKTIKNTVDIWGDTANAILSITNGAKVTITGNGTIDAKENDCYTINVAKGDLTIENGTFYGNVSVVQVEEGTLSVKGGTFDLHQKWEGSSKYLFNCIDSEFTSGNAKVAISGGTFVGFDPNVSPEQKVDGKTPSFAAPGVGITKNENGSFTAVDGMTAQILDKDGNSVKAYNTLAEAVAAAEDGQTVRLLADVTLDAQIATGKAITIDGQSKYTIKTVKKLASADGKAGMFYRTQSAKGTLTFLNVTLDGGGVSKIFLNEGGAGETVFDGVTSTNGGGIAYGSGIHISGGGSHATIRNSTLTGSTGTMELNNANYYAANDLWVGGNVYVTVENSVIGNVFVNSAPSATATNGVVHGQLTITGEKTKITYLSGEEEAADKLDKFGNNGSLVKIDSGYVEKVFDKGSYAISGGTFKTEVKKEWCAAGYVPTQNADGTYGVEIGKFTVMVTSRTTGSDSPVANVAGGGSDITYAVGTKVTASAISGYKFVGWFVNEYTGTPYSTDLTCKVKPTDDWTMIAVYEPISGGVFALEVSASKFTVNGGATQRSYLLEKMPVGTQVTVVFKGSENFLYWVNESGKVVSTSKTYTFSMGSATTLKAVYAEKEEHQAMVVFISHTQQVISSKGYTDTQEIQFPEPPIKMGATFVRWSMTEAEIRAAMATTTTGIIVVEPVYEFSAGSYTVTVNYPNDETATYTATVGKITTVTAKSIDGKVFKCWKNGDTVLGYTETLKIAPRGDLTLTAEYVDAGTTVDRLPVIALTEISASQQGAKYAVSFTATRSVPDGYTVTEQGILVSTNSRYGQSDALDAMKLDANGAKPDDTFILKATNTDATGVTVLNGTVSAADRTVYGRAYMILHDSSGAMVYVYSDTILSGSYNSLTTNGGN